MLMHFISLTGRDVSKRTRFAARFAVAGVTTVLAVALSACGGKSTEDLLASAQTYLDRGEPKSSMIQVKSALQKGDSAKGRYLLGRGLLMSGDAAAAEVEMRKAMTMGYPPAEVHPWLAEAMLGSGKNKELVEAYAAFGLDDRKALAHVKTSLAVAYGRLSKLDLGERAIDDALVADPTRAAALLVKARLLAIRGDADGALKLADKMLALAPADHDALLFKGDVKLRLQGQADAARADYRAAVAAKPSSLLAHSNLISMALGTRDIDGAVAQMATLKEVKGLAGNPQAMYLETRVALAKGDVPQAKSLASQLLKAAPEHPLVLELVGLVAYEAKDWPDALAHLQNAVRARGDLTHARWGLTRAQLRMSQPSKALATLQPLMSGDKVDSVTLALAGEAHVQLQELDKATALFQRASQTNPADPTGRTALAVLRLSQGQVESAITELDHIAESDRGTSADMALVMALLQSSQHQAARKAALRLARKMPNKPEPHYLRGLAQVGLKQLVEARGSFEQALEVETTYFPAVAQLVRIDVDANESARAQASVDKFLAARPGHGAATLLQAQLRKQAGATGADLAGLFASAIKSNPTDPQLRLAAIQQQVANGRRDLALMTATEAAVAFPNHAGVLDALGRSQLVAGEKAQAMSTFTKLAALPNEARLGHVRLAEAHVAGKDFASARASLARAASASGASMDVDVYRAQLEAAAGDVAAATTIAKRLQQQHKTLALGYVIEADLHAKAQRWTDAATAYRLGYLRQPSSTLAARWHDAATMANKPTEAQAAIQAWTKERPGDVSLTFLLGQNALRRGQYERAEHHFSQVIERKPKDAAALNNAAWAKLQRGNDHAAGALAFAERARDVEPHNPAILETVALAMSSQGKAADAVALVKRALTLAPGMNDLKLTLAKLHLQLNQKTDAKTELSALKQLGTTYEKHAEVAKLLEGV